MSEVMHHVGSKKEGVTFSKEAQKRLLNYLAAQGDFKTIRLSVKKTGCSGLSYVIDYVEKPHDGDLVFPFEQHCQISIDKTSYPYLKGMHIDYIKQGLSHKFVFNNPNQTGQCGCGESFTVD